MFVKIPDNTSHPHHSLDAIPKVNAALAKALNPFKEDDPDNRVWTGGEQSLFRVLVRVFLNNYCAIAQTLVTKNCQQVSQTISNKILRQGTLIKPLILLQVFAFAQEDADNLDNDMENLRENTPPKKKKKKKHSQWLNHCRKTQFKDSAGGNNQVNNDVHN